MNFLGSINIKYKLDSSQQISVSTLRTRTDDAQHVAAQSPRQLLAPHVSNKSGAGVALTLEGKTGSADRLDKEFERF